MKKWITLLLALLLLTSLCACGEKQEGTSIADMAKNPAVDELESQPQPEPTPEPEPEPEPTPEVELTTIETKLFTVSFPADDGWDYEEDDVSDGNSYCSFDCYLWGEDGNREAAVRIYAGLEDAHDYRERLYDLGFDEYALVVENAYAEDTFTIGGQQLLKWVNESGDTLYYFGRNESAGASMLFRVWDDIDDERVKHLLDTLQFHLEETGNVDGPWYWEGEPFRRESRSAMAGTYTLTSEFIPAAEPIITHETFAHDIEVVGDQAYILSNGVLLQYAFDGTSLRYVQELAAGEGYERIDASDDGTLLLSDFPSAYIGLADGEAVFRYDGPDYFAAAPDGTWGISYFTNPEDVVRYSFAGGAMQSEPFPVTGLSMATNIWIDEEHVYITGPEAESGAQVVQVYDHAGALQMTLTNSGSGLGSVSFIAKTANGFLALDGNMRKVVLWNANGDFIGAVDDGDIFGTSYPWFCAADPLPDGSILVIMTEDRDDDSAMELIAFRLSGF